MSESSYFNTIVEFVRLEFIYYTYLNITISIFKNPAKFERYKSLQKNHLFRAAGRSENLGMPVFPWENHFDLITHILF